jgi:hypothetical protein
MCQRIQPSAVLLFVQHGIFTHAAYNVWQKKQSQGYFHKMEPEAGEGNVHEIPHPRE